MQTRSGPINISRFRKSVEDAIAPIEVDGPATCGIRWLVTLTDAAACRDVKSVETVAAVAFREYDTKGSEVVTRRNAPIAP